MTNATFDTNTYHVRDDLGDEWEGHPELDHIQPRIRLHAVPIGVLIEDPANVRLHPTVNLEGIRGSYAKYKQRVLLVVNARTMIVEKGNGSLRCLRAGGFGYAAVLWVDDDPATATGFSIADNRTAEQASWDLPALFDQLNALKEIDYEVPGIDAAFFDEIQTLVKGAEFVPEGSDAPDPGVTTPPTDPVSKVGEVYVLGPHRIMCGDSTNAEDVARLLGGEKPRLMVTDQPYGVNYDPTWRDDAGVAPGVRRGVVENDDRADWTEAYMLFPGDVAYLWCASLFLPEVVASIGQVDFDWRSLIIWKKATFTFGRGHYHWSHEPCIYAVRKGSTAGWIGDRKQTTVWEIAQVGGFGSSREADDASTPHSTQKPVECMERPIRNHEGDVYDPFLGSGTTLIAAARQGRRCFGMEISERYSDVIRKRWGEWAKAAGVDAGEGAL